MSQGWTLSRKLPGAQKAENMTLKEKKNQLIETSSEVAQMLELADEDVKRVAVTVFRTHTHKLHVLSRHGAVEETQIKLLEAKMTNCSV